MSVSVGDNKVDSLNGGVCMFLKRLNVNYWIIKKHSVLSSLFCNLELWLFQEGKEFKEADVYQMNPPKYNKVEDERSLCVV
jgi:hypothetical protein